MSISSPSAVLHRLGRGVVYLAPWGLDLSPPSEIDLIDIGACSDFMVELVEENLEFFQVHSGGVRSLDRVEVVASGYGISFIAEEVSSANLARHFRGTLSGNVIYAHTAYVVPYLLCFVADNPSGDSPERWDFWKVHLFPKNTIALISENQWSGLSFGGMGLLDKENHPLSPFYTVQLGALALSTTTT